MGEKIFDDVARTLAQPMPRRRALRLLGTSLLVFSVPGMRPRLARAASGSSKCGYDQRVCREFTDQQYCCPRPSWQHFCGRRPRQCDNICAGETEFPCTGLLPDRFSGVNGVCCDKKYHSRCRPDNPRDRLSGGGSRPLCLPCTGVLCGPNKKYGEGHPQRWTCCEKQNVCRMLPLGKGFACKCADGSTSCDGSDCCKKPKACKQCVDADSSSLTLTGTAKCCRKDEVCCLNRCCKRDQECCRDKCCPRGTVCGLGPGGRDVCCPTSRADETGKTTICCPSGTYPIETVGCCPPGLARCCDGLVCRGGQICVSGECV